MQDALRHGIGLGALALCGSILFEREIAGANGLSRITVRNAIKGLLADGLLISRQEAVSFVSEPFEKQLSKQASFSEDIVSLGRVLCSDRADQELVSWCRLRVCRRTRRAIVTAANEVTPVFLEAEAQAKTLLTISRS
jgi:DNA-binding GntR family transcriptional regulator